MVDIRDYPNPLFDLFVETFGAYDADGKIVFPGGRPSVGQFDDFVLTGITMTATVLISSTTFADRGHATVYLFCTFG